jgi:hypothetical protein
MGLLARILERLSGRGSGLTPEDLAARLGMTVSALRAVPVEYREFSIPKRDGTMRRLAAPGPELKRVQRLILRRVLGRLRVHQAVVGFERGLSFVDHARAHCGRAIVVRIDLKDFFPSTSRKRTMAYLRRIGWGRAAAEEICRLCCKDGSLPQGAPTSPRLANLVNVRMDRRLVGAAAASGAVYTRYADDLVFSFADDEPARARTLINLARAIVADAGYRFNRRKGPRVLRAHQRQVVTGLVVNGGPPRLSRKTRRWLRAVEHRALPGSTQAGPPTLSTSQRQGWRALVSMIEARGSAPENA